ncbi:MAG TPA: VOC family protein [Candidatus Limnocylindrales bacterium]|nr:VOC family protein [Candidatus Limnocylindrales bacterium]
MGHGQITHVELPADDVERARRFYAELLGWQFGTDEAYPGYHMFNAGTAQIGGAVGKRGESTGDRMRVYCEVDSIDDILGRVEGLGGSISQPRTEIPGQGWYAAIVDTEGNELGLYEGQ